MLRPRKTRRSPLRRLLIPLAAALLLAAGLTLFRFRKELDLDRVRRWFRYLGVTDSNGFYSFDAHNANAYALLGDGLAVASVSGLDLYGASGEELASVPGAVDAPAIETGDDLALLWDMGGTVLSAASARTGQTFDLKLDRPLLDADVSDRGEICYASAEAGFRTVLTMLDASQQKRYYWQSASRYLPRCAISDGGGVLAAVAVGQSDGVFFSSLQIFYTDREEPGPSAPLGEQMIYDLDFIGKDVLCCVGENSLLFFNTQGIKLGEYDYGGGYLRDFSIHGDGFAAICLSAYQAGSRCELVSVGPDGLALGRYPFDEDVQALSAAGDYVGALSPGRFHVFTSELAPYGGTEEVSGATGALVREDGTALLIGGGEAHLFLP